MLAPFPVGKLIFAVLKVKLELHGTALLTPTLILHMVVVEGMNGTYFLGYKVRHRARGNTLKGTDVLE